MLSHPFGAMPRPKDFHAMSTVTRSVPRLFTSSLREVGAWSTVRAGDTVSATGRALTASAEAGAAAVAATTTVAKASLTVRSR
jgi:hypothetical protein